MAKSPGTDIVFCIFLEDATDAQFSMMPVRSRGIVMSIRSVSNISCKALCSSLADFLSPDIVFNSDVASHPIIWSELRNMLAQRNVQLIVHERRRYVYIIANSLYSEKDGKEIALDLADDVLNPSRRANNAARGPQTVPHSPHNGSVGKTAHNLALRQKGVD